MKNKCPKYRNINNMWPDFQKCPEITLKCISLIDMFYVIRMPETFIVNGKTLCHDDAYIVGVTDEFKHGHLVWELGKDTKGIYFYTPFISKQDNGKKFGWYYIRDVNTHMQILNLKK